MEETAIECSYSLKNKDFNQQLSPRTCIITRMLNISNKDADFLDNDDMISADHENTHKTNK